MKYRRQRRRRKGEERNKGKTGRLAWAEPCRLPCAGEEEEKFEKAYIDKEVEAFTVLKNGHVLSYRGPVDRREPGVVFLVNEACMKVFRCSIVQVKFTHTSKKYEIECCSPSKGRIQRFIARIRTVSSTNEQSCVHKGAHSVRLSISSKQENRVYRTVFMRFFV